MKEISIIELQNNYTTPEQSKRLLELGIPAESADMWLEKSETIRINGEWVHGADWDKVPSHFNWDRENNRFYTYSEVKEAVSNFAGYDTLPCWSVGRLIEIILICNDSESARIAFDRPLYDISCCTNIEWAIRCIESACKTGHIDFLKLKNKNNVR